MQTQFTIAVPKAAKSFDLDTAKLPENAMEYVVEYGLRQILSDCLSGADNPKNLSGDRKAKAEAENAKAVAAKIEALMNGTVRMARTTTADPVEREARRIAIDQVQGHPSWKAWLATNGLKAADDKARVKFAELVKARAADPKVIAEAQDRVAKADKLAGFDLDL